MFLLYPMYSVWYAKPSAGKVFDFLEMFSVFASLSQTDFNIFQEQGICVLRRENR